MVIVDATGRQGYIRVPLDGNGKRSATIKVLAVEYGSGTVAFSKGDIVTGATSTTFGTIIHIQGTVSTGTIYVILTAHDSLVTNFTVAEDLQVGGSTHATVTSEVEIHYQANTIVGANNPLNAQNISAEGSAQIGYADGEQQLDAFGATKVSQPFLIDQIVFTYDSNSLRFYDNVSGSGASLTHLSQSESVAMDIGTNNGEICQRTTHVYYPYTPGFGALSEMTVLCGDSGKTGVIRRWGRFDDNDGLFFEQSGSDFNIVQRSSAGGTVTETRVSQSAFNHDALDGTGASDSSVDLAKLNLYWLDYAWLGAGPARLGLYNNDGVRVVAHAFKNPGQRVLPYMRRGSLPFRAEILNTQATASPSRLTITCISAKTDGFEFKPSSKFGKQYSKQNEEAITCDPNTWTPLLTWRGTDVISGTDIPNHQLSVPSTIGGYTDSPIATRLYNFTVVNTASWEPYGTSGLQFSVSSSSVLGGNVANSWFQEASSSWTHSVNEFFQFGTVATSRADGTPGRVWVYAGKSIVPGVTASVFARMDWTDLE